MRDRIPFLFAALLVAALVGLVGLAAFSISGAPEPVPEETFDGPISARVASAALAASVSTAPSETLATASIEALSAESAEPLEEPEATGTTAAATTTETTDTTPPPIAIIFPADRATVDKHVVQFTGTSEPGAAVTSGPFEAATALNGDWTISLVVEEGYNSTVFTATDEAGNETSVRIVVFYEPPPAPTTTTTHTHPPAETTTTHTHAPPTTTSPPSDPSCLVAGSCSPSWPADSDGARGGEAWRSVVEQYWPAERVQCVVDLIQKESTGNPQANNPAGPYLGLLQHSGWAWNGRASAIGLIDADGFTAHPYNGAANIAAAAWLANNSSPWWRPWPPTGNIPSCQALGAG